MRQILINAGSTIHVLADTVFNKLDKNFDFHSYVAAIPLRNMNILYLQPNLSGDNYSQKLIDNLKTYIVNEKNFLLKENINYQKLFTYFFHKHSSFQKYITFLSPVEIINKHIIAIILQLDKKTFKSYKQSKNIKLYSSLLDGVITRFFNVSQHFLKNFISTNFWPPFESGYEILRVAGEGLIQSITRISIDSDNTESRSKSILGLNNIYYNLTSISNLSYEGKSIKGKIIISGFPNKNITKQISFKKKIPLDYHIAIRKLLELSADKNYLLYHSGEIFGIGSLNTTYYKKSENLFIINFPRTNTWELINGNKKLMTVKNGIPLLKEEIYNFKEIENSLIMTFKNLSINIISNIIKIIKKAHTNCKGTIIIIAENASGEADRLKNEAILVDPFHLTDKNIIEFTSIDGAILIDTNCTCYSIGTILDGEISERGESSRGSRYNSTVRYIDTWNDTSKYAVIISDDGYIDILSNRCSTPSPNI